ncbi:FdhF/YdeP family oxidoreductase [Pirellulales bacterium]|nr:FdhF/YdeP family oxidoreductase [Pirellulales bacterium]
MVKVRTGGGWRAIHYTLKKAYEAGGFWSLWKAMRSKNACKTCALGMGGQAGGMVNESGHFPEVCKKSFQAMVADMQDAIPDDFFHTYSIAQLKKFTPFQMEHAGRLVKPLLLQKGSQHYRPIPWSEAFERIGKKLQDVEPRKSFWYFSGRSSNEAGFLLQLFARLYGTNHINNCSYYCHQASGVGLTSVIGTGAGTIQLEDLEKSDFVMLIGGNPASNHPRMMRSLMMVRRRGGKIVVVNPMIETGLVNFSVPSDLVSLLFGTKIASSYVQPLLGGDLALLYGLMKRLKELHAAELNNVPEPIVDEEFLAEHTHGWNELAERLEGLSWDEIIEKSGVSKADIDDITVQYAASKRAVFAWTMGVTHHLHGSATVQAIAQLALMRKMIGRPGAGLQPIRGHSNIQGMGTVGVTPKLKDKIFERLESELGVTLPSFRGFDTVECLEAAEQGNMQLAFCLGGNLFGASPDARFASRALARTDMTVYMNTSLNTGHACGTAQEDTLILPVLARDEEPEPSTQESMFSYIRLSDGGEPRHERGADSGPRSEVEIIAEIGRRVLGTSGPVNWLEMSHTSTIRKAISRIIPGLEQMSQIDKTKDEFFIPGRSINTPTFPTDDGKAIFHVHDLPDVPDGLQLMTIRSEGQFNTVVYEEEDLYRNQSRRDIVLMHPDDISIYRLSEGVLCCVQSDVGEMRHVTVSAYPGIRQGCVAMYYPESNVLIPKKVDPLSRTPSYKRVAVRIVREDGSFEDKPEGKPLTGRTGTPREKMNQC